VNASRDASTPARVRALIVDDEALARRRLAAMLATEPAIQLIGEADGGSAAVCAIASERPDLVFLDVQMPGLDGFGVLRCTAGAYRPAIVFVTAYDEHAIRAFDVNAVDYLLKPVSAARLTEAVRRVVERIRNSSRREDSGVLDRLLSQASPAARARPAERIAIRQPDGTRFVDIAAITRIEADRDHVRVYAGATVYTVRQTLTGFAAELRPFGFIRVHRTAIINPNSVRLVESRAKGGHILTLYDGARVRCGRQYRHAVQSLTKTFAR
jgi:two-component system LytT family response regulator